MKITTSYKDDVFSVGLLIAEMCLQSSDFIEISKDSEALVRVLEVVKAKGYSQTLLNVIHQMC